MLFSLSFSSPWTSFHRVHIKGPEDIPLLVESRQVPKPVPPWSTKSLLPQKRASPPTIPREVRVAHSLFTLYITTYNIYMCMNVWSLLFILLSPTLLFPSFSSSTEWKECPEYIFSNRECFFDVHHTSIWIPYCVQLRSQDNTTYFDENCFTVENIG